MQTAEGSLLLLRGCKEQHCQSLKPLPQLIQGLLAMTKERQEYLKVENGKRTQTLIGLREDIHTEEYIFCRANQALHELRQQLRNALARFLGKL